MLPSMREPLSAFGCLVLVGVTLTACASFTSTTTTLMAGWERHFAIEWTVDPESGGVRLVHGFVTSQHGEYAEPVRLLAQALDASGAVIGQQLVWVPGGVNGSQRAYFEVGRLPTAGQYRVSVWEYTFIQNEGWL